MIQYYSPRRNDAMSCKSELCIFNKALPQVVIKSGAFVTYYPQQAPNSSVIDFYVNSPENGYIDLSHTTLYVRCKVMINGNAIKQDSEISASNYLFHTLFEDAKLFFNNTLVEGGDGDYIQKCHLESRLNYSSDTMETQLLSIGYCPDENVRWEWVKGSKSIELCGPIRLDMFSQPRCLVPGVNLKLSLRRAKPAYNLHVWGKNVNSKPDLVFEEASLCMRHVKVDPSVSMGHQIGLSNQNAIYPFTRGKVVSYNISKGSLSFFKDMLFGDMVQPKFVIVGLSPTTCYNGSYHKKEMHYYNFDVSSIVLHQNSDVIERYDTNFADASRKVVEAYTKSIIRNLNHLEKNTNVGITLQEFISDGSTLFTFNLSPDFDSTNTQAVKDGNLRMEIKFNSALAEAINVVIYGIFDDEIQVTKSGEVIKV